MRSCFAWPTRRRRSPLATAASHERRRGASQPTKARAGTLMDGNSGPPVGGQTAGRWPETTRGVIRIRLNLEAAI
jgi:hypothetical protein